MSIELRNVSYSYENAEFEHSGRKILDGINLTVSRQEFVALIGATGSGKSTLIQHFNGLLKAAEGEVFYYDKCIYDSDFNLKGLRANVGLVFQYPEYQLFETDVFTDVCFGPKNLGLVQGEIESRARKALTLVGIEEKDWHRSPFELSGGQKRRVAIAGVLAMRPKFLILDEPAAGLDPRGRREIFDIIKNLHKESNIGVVIVSHSMEDVADYAERLIVMDKGRIRFDDTPAQVFAHREELEAIGLSVPQATLIADKLRERGVHLPENIITNEDLVEAVKNIK